MGIFPLSFRSMAILATFIVLSTGCDNSNAPASDPRLYLQQITNTSAIVRWRGNPGSVYYGSNPANLNQTIVGANIGASDYQAKLNGLSSDTTYYFRLDVGSAINGQRFRTAPATGQLPSDGSTRVWLVGDSGTGDSNAKAVRDAYYNFNGGADADLFVMLGDNAYNDGTDTDYQNAVFNVYTDLLLRTAVWPTIGNHEAGVGGSNVADSLGNAPYINIFTLPTNAEAGGVASGTEQYYSFNYANIHFVSLDTQATARNTTKRNAMKNWLIDDLSSSQADWNIVFFHHPPYSKGSHNSDVAGFLNVDKPMIDMREEFTPIFDDYGVDLVFSGHSHSYERSYYLNGHTGLSGTFNPAIHAEHNGAGELMDGRSDGTGEYGQITNDGLDDKVVYTVAGSSGKISGGSLNHPAHFSSLNVLGSVVLDIDQYFIQAKFIDNNGVVRDYYTVTR